MNVEELHRQVEYKFAPEPLIAVQALTNTYSFEDDEELLADPEAARRWLLDSALVHPSTPVSASEHQALVELREAIRSILDAGIDGEVDPDSNRRLARIAAEHPLALAVSGSGEVALDLEPARSIDGVIAQMLGIVFQAQRAEEWPRLKICASDECRWAFYDSSRNRGGTWCKMEVCGNRIKNRRYRSRESKPAG